MSFFHLKFGISIYSINFEKNNLRMKNKTTNTFKFIANMARILRGGGLSEFTPVIYF